MYRYTHTYMYMSDIYMCMYQTYTYFYICIFQIYIITLPTLPAGGAAEKWPPLILMDNFWTTRLFKQLG